jgi:hypothetical protein
LCGLVRNDDFLNMLERLRPPGDFFVDSKGPGGGLANIILECGRELVWGQEKVEREDVGRSGGGGSKKAWELNLRNLCGFV